MLEETIHALNTLGYLVSVCQITDTEWMATLWKKGQVVGYGKADNHTAALTTAHTHSLRVRIVPEVRYSTPSVRAARIGRVTLEDL